MSFQKAKSAWLFPMDKLNDDEINDFYQKCLVPLYYDNVIKELKQKRSWIFSVYLFRLQ
ncbi:hypothetical protein SD457_18275 [Coprobacillaceae bacterium CR2/5/TPMF4]|nr:hypothetical protein SD457_18275 [Coprobacillaceae bacterium CR2/5/TPMF4]